MKLLNATSSIRRRTVDHLGRKAMPSAKSVDPSLRKAVEGISTTYKEQFNKQDAVGLAEGVFTKDGVLDRTIARRAG